MVSKSAQSGQESLQRSLHSKNCSVVTCATHDDHTPLPENTLKKLSQEAREMVPDRFKALESYDFACRRLELFPKFDFTELELGTILGKGQFGVVTEIRGFNLFENHRSSLGNMQIKSNWEDRNFMSVHCTRRGSQGAALSSSSRYAIKMLDQKHCAKEDEFFTGVLDMAIEAHFLAAMEHPHVLKLRGLSVDPYGSKNFFVVFDRLYGTLNERIEEWRFQQHRITRGFKGLFKRQITKEKKRDLLITRLRAMRDLASAVMYLHHNHIIDRDLKPDNIGFDIRGDVKLFDFGLSTVADQSRPKPYLLTGMTGSIKYMAPEVYNCRPYDETCDIYSMGLIFWRILSLEPLFAHMNRNMIKNAVVDGGARPALNSKWPGSLRDLITGMWHADADFRPTAKRVLLVVRRELALIKEKQKLDEDRASDSASNCSDNKQVLLTRKSTYNQRRFTSSRYLHV